MSGEKQEILSVAKALFFGEVQEEVVFPFPSFTDQQKEFGKEMVNAVNKFGEDQIDSEKMDHEEVIPQEVMQGLAELGLFGLAVDEDSGGMGLDYTLYSRVFQEVAYFDGSIATMLGAHQSIGYRALLNEGTEEQKKKWLPLLASGEKLAAFCLTEPGSGSDAYSIKTKAVDNGDGTFTINGQKLWITNGGSAEFYSVFCKTDHKKDGEDVEKITCFLVEKSFDGVSFGEKEKKMGIRASETRAVYFDNVKVPKENIIGEYGRGFKVAMNVLNSGRLSLGAGCVGGMKHVLKLATAHAKGRKQFGSSIAEFGLIQDKLSTMAANIFAVESTVYFTTGKMVQGMSDYSVESAICKVFGSEELWETVDMALQIAAGCGYMKEYPYERILRDSRINLIFEGTNEILRCFIALSGIKGPSENLKELGKITDFSNVLDDPIKSLGTLSNFAKNRIGKIISTRTFTKIHEDFELEASKLGSMVGDFSIKVENTLMKYGKKIIGNELPQKRIAEMAIDLYVILAVLSRATMVLQQDEVDDAKKEYVKKLAKISFTKRRQRFKKNLKHMNFNSDKEIKSVSKQVCDYDGYGLDVVDF